MSKKILLAAAMSGAFALGLTSAASAQSLPTAAVDAKIQALYPKVVSWRRDLHEHPELGNQEVRTSKLVADHLRALGIEVRTGVARTGVVGVLKGGKPGGVVALRADMDALPVLEQTGEPFASKATAEYGGKTVPVMHACGHDSHTAMLMGTAEILAGRKDQIAGTVVLIFQPAEEGSLPGEEGGAPLMVKEGAFNAPKPGAVIGLHVFPGPVGRITTRPGPFFAGSDTMSIKLHGKGTHGAQPWNGVDVVSLSAAIIQGLNTIVARQVDLTASPTVITIGQVLAGTRHNVIPEDAVLNGTVRTYGAERRADVLARIKRTVADLADSYGATAEVSFSGTNPAVENDAKLTALLGPALTAAAGAAGADLNARPVTTSEDFSYFAQVAPTAYFLVGSTPNFKDYASAPANHSPHFDIDEKAMQTGMKAEVLAALTYLNSVARK